MFGLLKRIEDERRIRVRRATGKRALGGTKFLALLLFFGLPALLYPIGWAFIVLALVLGLVFTVLIVTAPLGLTFL